MLNFSPISLNMHDEANIYEVSNIFINRFVLALHVVIKHFLKDYILIAYIHSYARVHRQQYISVCTWLCCLVMRYSNMNVGSLAVTF